MPVLLRDLQEQFIANLHAVAPQAMHKLIEARKHVSRAQQFTIYQTSIMGNFQKALQDIYPVCKQIVGDAFFNGCSAAYIKQTPSYSHDLNDYGLSFAEFIQHFPPAASLPYLPDVARLEWAWHRTTHAPVDNFDFAKLAGSLQAETLHFLLPQRSTLLATPYPVLRIWQVNQKNFTADKTVILQPDEQYYFFIWQKNYILSIDEIDFADWQLLTWIHAGLSVTQLTQQLAAEFPDVDIPALFASLVQKGWIAGFAL